MPYALPSDMIARFGVTEMIRLTVPQDQDMTQVNTAPILIALGDATDTINTYISKRYATPLAQVPASVNRACCLLARFDLYTGDGREPSEQVRLSRKETITWLEQIATGKVLLPITELAGDDSFAIMSDRSAVYGPGAGANVFPAQSGPAGAPYQGSDQGGYPSGGGSGDLAIGDWRGDV